MKEQPQRPEESQEQQDNLASAINKLAKSRTAWMLYAQSLERENTTLKERVAELSWKPIQECKSMIYYLVGRKDYIPAVAMYNGVMWREMGKSRPLHYEPTHFKELEPTQEAQ